MSNTDLMCYKEILKPEEVESLLNETKNKLFNELLREFTDYKDSLFATREFVKGKRGTFVPTCIIDQIFGHLPKYEKKLSVRNMDKDRTFVMSRESFCSIFQWNEKGDLEIEKNDKQIIMQFPCLIYFDKKGNEAKFCLKLIVKRGDKELPWRFDPYPMKKIHSWKPKPQKTPKLKTEKRKGIALRKIGNKK